MQRSGMFYEITFFIYLVYVFISKWVDYPLVRKIALITVAIAALYQLLYLLFLRRKDYISFGRCLGIGCFYTALVIFLMFLVFTVFAFLGGTNIAAGVVDETNRIAARGSTPTPLRPKR